MSKNANGPGNAEFVFDFSCEGPAILSPGMIRAVFKRNDEITDDIPMAELADWVAVTAICGAANSAHNDAVRAKTRTALLPWYQRQGQAKLDQLRRMVTEDMLKDLPKGRLTEEQLRQRIDAFFDSIRA